MNINSVNEVNLPQEMYEEIFSYLTGPELTKCSQVSKEWHEVAGSNRLWLGVVEQYAFGAKKWKQYFGDIGQKTALPSDILKVLRSSCPFVPSAQVGKTHVLVWLPQMESFLTPISINCLKV